MRICYWSIAWGQYSYILQSLVKSYNDIGLNPENFHVFCDQNLKFCVNHGLDPKIELDKLQFFKFFYLKNQVQKLDYDVFVFIDADHLFVRKPEIEIEQILSDGSDWHSFLESPVNSEKTQRQDWWGINNIDLVKYFIDLGINQTEIRNTNGGFWICKKHFINEAFDLAFKCHNYLKSKNHIVPEEVSIGYISHLTNNPKQRYAEKYLNYWASDWTGNFLNQIPQNRHWEWVSYMTNEKFLVNPAIVHGMRSKNALIENGRNILTN